MKNDKIITCDKCGVCCQLFLINLNESEYLSGRYTSVFEDTRLFDDFDEAEMYGANILSQQTDGSCIYLKKGECSIHKNRPAVCRDFFCADDRPEHAEMRAAIAAAKNRNYLMSCRRLKS